MYEYFGRPWAKTLYSKLTHKKRRALHLSSVGVVVRRKKFGIEKVWGAWQFLSLWHIIVSSLASSLQPLPANKHNVSGPRYGAEKLKATQVYPRGYAKKVLLEHNMCKDR